MDAVSINGRFRVHVSHTLRKTSQSLTVRVKPAHRCTLVGCIGFRFAAEQLADLRLGLATIEVLFSNRDRASAPCMG